MNLNISSNSTLDLSRFSMREFEQIYQNQKEFFFKNDGRSSDKLLSEDELDTDTLEPIFTANKDYLMSKKELDNHENSNLKNLSSYNYEKASIVSPENTIRTSLDNANEKMMRFCANEKNLHDQENKLTRSIKKFLIEECNEKFGLLNNLFELLTTLQSGMPVSELSPDLYSNLTKLLNGKLTLIKSRKKDKDTQTEIRYISKTNSYTQCREITPIYKGCYKNLKNGCVRCGNERTKKRSNRIYSHLTEVYGGQNNTASTSDSSGYTSDRCHDTSKWSKICSQLCVLSRELVESQRILTRQLVDDKKSLSSRLSQTGSKSKFDDGFNVSHDDKEDLLKPNNHKKDVYYAKLMPGNSERLKEKLNRCRKNSLSSEKSLEGDDKQALKLMDIIEQLQKEDPQLATNFIDNLIEYGRNGSEGWNALMLKLKLPVRSQKTFNLERKLDSSSLNNKDNAESPKEYFNEWKARLHSGEDKFSSDLSTRNTSVSEEETTQTDDSLVFPMQDKPYRLFSSVNSPNNYGKKMTEYSNKHLDNLMNSHNGPFLKRNKNGVVQSMRTRAAVNNEKDTFTDPNIPLKRKLSNGPQYFNVESHNGREEEKNYRNISSKIIDNIDFRIKYLFDKVLNQLKTSNIEVSFKNSQGEVISENDNPHIFSMGLLGPGMNNWICTSIIRRVHQLTKSWIPLKAFQSRHCDKNRGRCQQMSQEKRYCQSNKNSFRFGWFENSDMKEDFNSYFIKQLEEQLRNTINHYEGKYLSESINEMMRELATILTDELTFYSLMTEKDTISEPSRDTQSSYWNEKSEMEANHKNLTQALNNTLHLEDVTQNHINTDEEDGIFKSEECLLDYATPRLQFSEESNVNFQNIESATFSCNNTGHINPEFTSNQEDQKDYMSTEKVSLEDQIITNGYEEGIEDLRGYIDNPSYSMRTNSYEDEMVHNESQEEDKTELYIDDDEGAMERQDEKGIESFESSSAILESLMKKSEKIAKYLEENNQQKRIQPLENSIYSESNYTWNDENGNKRNHYNTLTMNTTNNVYHDRSVEIEDLSLLTIDTMELPTFITAEEYATKSQQGEQQKLKFLKHPLNHRKFKIIEESTGFNEIENQLSSYQRGQVY